MQDNPAAESQVCACCKKGSMPTNTLKKCSACKRVLYCSKECQSRHWKEGHKKVCKKLQTAVSMAAMAVDLLGLEREGTAEKLLAISNANLDIESFSTEERLFHYIATGATTQALEMLKSQPQLMSCKCNGIPPCFFAAAQGNEEVMKFFYSKDAADVQQRIKVLGMEFNIAEHLFLFCCHANITALTDKAVRDKHATFSFVLGQGARIDPTRNPLVKLPWRCKICSTLFQTSSESDLKLHIDSSEHLQQALALHQTRRADKPFEHAQSLAGNHPRKTPSGRFGQTATGIRRAVADMRHNFAGAPQWANWIEVLERVAGAMEEGQEACVIPETVGDEYLCSDLHLVANISWRAEPQLYWVVGTGSREVLKNAYETYEPLMSADKAVPEKRRSGLTSVKKGDGLIHLQRNNGAETWLCEGEPQLLMAIRHFNVKFGAAATVNQAASVQGPGSTSSTSSSDPPHALQPVLVALPCPVGVREAAEFKRGILDLCNRHSSSLAIFLVLVQHPAFGGGPGAR